MRLFDLSITERPGGALVALSGEIDMSTVEELDGRLRTVLDAGPERVVLDLTAVTFLDSSGLRLVLRLDERLRKAGASLVVVPGGRRVSRVFELTGADEQLEIAATADGAGEPAPGPGPAPETPTQ